MDLIHQPDRLQNWFEQFPLLQKSGDFWSEILGFPVAPFRAFLFDFIGIIVCFYLVVVGIGLIQKFRYRKYRLGKPQF